MKNVLRENEQKGLIFVSVIVTHLHIFREKILVMLVCVTRMNGSKWGNFWSWMMEKWMSYCDFEVRIAIYAYHTSNSKCFQFWSSKSIPSTHIIPILTQNNSFGFHSIHFSHSVSSILSQIILFIWNIFYFRQLPIKPTSPTHMHDFLTCKTYRDCNVTCRKRKLARMLHARH